MSSRSGFTLLEVILSLALAALVFVALAMAIDIHLRVVDVGRTKVEEAQLARTLLVKIADDIRGAVRYQPMDAASLLSELTDVAELPEGAEELAGQMGVELPDSDEEDRTSDLSDPTSIPAMPGLYGNRHELQVDISRLPRLDQFEHQLASATGSSVTDRLSDVKTVAYYVTRQSGLQEQGGLVRRELDRAVTAWAEEQGTLADMELENQLNGEPLAPEVAAIEFRYFDGGEWHEEWDSIQRNGLPLAVEIGIAILPPRHRDTWFASEPSDEKAFDETESPHVYRLIVHLPLAEATSSDEESAEPEEEEDGQ